MRTTLVNVQEFMKAHLLDFLCIVTAMRETGANVTLTAQQAEAAKRWELCSITGVTATGTGANFTSVVMEVMLAVERELLNTMK